LHSAIGYLSPVDYENEYRHQCSTATSDREVA
jgi:putative transposase